jgi:hypothetical protein
MTKENVSCKEILIVIQGVEFLANLIVLGTQGLDVILGMDWVSKYKGMIDCARKAITMTNSNGVEITHTAVMHSSQAYYHKIISGPTLDQVPVVCEYPDVFPEELPGMPPDRDIEFIIELIQGKTPIAQRSYHMNAEDLVELKKQLADMLSKGFIHPSASP